MAALVVGLVLAAGLASCGGSDNEYPPEAEANFMASCEATSGGNTSGCQCAFDSIEEELSYDEFRKIETNIAAGGTPPRELTDAMVDCVEN